MFVSLHLALALASLQPAESADATRDADGGFTIHRPILADPAPLWLTSDGLIEEWDDSSREQRDEMAIQDDIDEAYEEAADWVRSTDPD